MSDFFTPNKKPKQPPPQTKACTTHQHLKLKVFILALKPEMENAAQGTTVVLKFALALTKKTAGKTPADEVKLRAR